MRTGIFGGTFNPIHNGHIKLARAYRSELELDRMLVIPTRIPPHKVSTELADGKDRLQMCRLAFAGQPEFEVSDIELCRTEPSYTVDTLEALHARWPEDELFLLTGSDMFLTFERWRRYREILGAAVRACGDVRGGAGAKFIRAASDLREVSGKPGGAVPCNRHRPGSGLFYRSAGAYPPGPADRPACPTCGCRLYR